MMRRLIGILKKAGVPIYLNVYDLTPINGVLHCFGLGIYLSAIEGALWSRLVPYSLAVPAIRYPREFQGHKRGCKSKECKGCIHVTDSLTIASSRIQQVSVSSFLQPLKRIVSARNVKLLVLFVWEFMLFSMMGSIYWPS